MKISNKRNEKLYDSIYEPITDLRVKVQIARIKNTEIDIDRELYNLLERIFDDVGNVLNLSIE